MKDTNLLQVVLGLTPPWRVVENTFDPAAHRIDIHLDFAPGSRFACPNCGAADCPVHDTAVSTWRHLNFFQHQAYLHARVPRKLASRISTARKARNRPPTTSSNDI